jgi:surfeit locus 1 family protein
MKIKVAGNSFNCSLIPILLYLALVTLLISLGFWQLGRADEKKIFLIKQQLSADKEVISLKSIIDVDPESLRYREIEISGRYDEEHQFLIDNQIVNGQAGYYVMTPLLVDGMKNAVLVNRGWVVLNKDRRVLPDISISTLQVKLLGRVNKFPSVGFKLDGAEIPTDGWPSVVQVVDSDVLAGRLGYSLLPFQVEMNAEMNEGYLREWRKNTVMPPEKHIAYAVQWFGLAITLTILFFWFSTKQK